MPKHIHNIKDKSEIVKVISQTRFVGFSTISRIIELYNRIYESDIR